MQPAEEIAGDSRTEGEDGRRNILFMSHGMDGTSHDWDIWMEMLPKRFPTWRFHPLESLAQGAKMFGSSVEQLADVASDEIVGVLREELKGRPASDLAMHCLGHSMGGLILRGMLLEVARQMGPDLPQLGHYMTVSSPHLGVQASWLAPFQAWKNYCDVTAAISQQQTQLAVMDTDRDLPYLVELGRKGSPHLELLGRFRHRSLVTMAREDPLVALPSALIDHRQEHDDAVSGRPQPFWNFERRAEAAADSGGCNHLDKRLQEPDKQRYLGEPPPPGSPCFKFIWRVIFGALLVVFGTAVRILAFLLHPLILCIKCMCCKAEPKRKQAIAAVGPGTPLKSEAAAGDEDEASAGQRDAMAVQSFSIEETSARQTRPSPLRRRDLTWQVSKDGSSRTPLQLIEGLQSLSWRRLVVNAFVPGGKNRHVFLIGKGEEQSAREHEMSLECIACLMELLAD